MPRARQRMAARAKPGLRRSARAAKVTSCVMWRKTSTRVSRRSRRWSIVRQAPLALHPAALLEAVEGGVERALADLEDLAGELLDPAGGGVAVGGAPGEGLEDEQVERPLEEVERGLGHGRLSFPSAFDVWVD